MRPKRTKAKESLPHGQDAMEKDIEARVREALKEPAAEITVEQYHRDMEAIAAGYINDFHRQHSKKLKDQLAKQPKATLEEALAQYEKIKKGSSRNNDKEEARPGDRAEPTRND